MSTFIVVFIMLAGLAAVTAVQHQRKRRAIKGLADHCFPIDEEVTFSEGKPNDFVTEYTTEYTRLPGDRLRGRVSFYCDDSFAETAKELLEAAGRDYDRRIEAQVASFQKLGAS